MHLHVMFPLFPENQKSIAHLSAEDMLKSGVLEEKKFKNIESEWFGPRSMKLGSKYDLLDTPRILKYKQIVWKYALSTILY